MIDFQQTVSPDGIATVSIQGRLGNTSCPYFFGCMRDLIDEGVRAIVVDCSELGAISSGCLGRLILARRRIRKNGGSILLANPSSSVLDVIRMMGLSGLFGVYSNVETALQVARHATDGVESVAEDHSHTAA